MNNQQVSVIIPIKNRANLIAQTLHNLLNQSLQPYEIIVVDDHSSDALLQILKPFKKKIIYLTNKRNGPGAARNYGLEIASGKYIQFLDSDDVITNNKLQIQSEKLNESSSGLIYCPYVHVGWDIANRKWHQKDIILQYSPIPKHKTLLQCMVKGFFTIIPSFLFDKDFLKTLGPWREDITAYEDWDYLWRIGKLNPNPPHTNECCYFYRIHGQQTTGTNFNDKQRDIQKIIVFQDIYKQYVVGDPNLTSVEKSFFKAQVFKSMKLLEFEKIDEVLFNQYSDFKTKLASNYLRVESKINRIITSSNWQIMHGISKSKIQFDEYLKMV